MVWVLRKKEIQIWAIEIDNNVDELFQRTNSIFSKLMARIKVTQSLIRSYIWILIIVLL